MKSLQAVPSKQNSPTCSILLSPSWILFPIYPLNFPSHYATSSPHSLSFYYSPIYFPYQHTIRHPLQMTKTLQGILLNPLSHHIRHLSLSLTPHIYSIYCSIYLLHPIYQHKHSNSSFHQHESYKYLVY